MYMFRNQSCREPNYQPVIAAGNDDDEDDDDDDDILVAFIIKSPIDPINPSETLRVHNKIQICWEASEKNLKNTDFYKPRP